MNIIIIGCGKIGASLAEQLNSEGHNITIVDRNEKAVSSLALSLDIIGVTGNGAMLDVQKEAGVETADILIAVTGSDEVNMLCCLIAKKEGHCYTVARIRNAEYENEIEYLKQELGLSYVINPEKMCAREIVRLLRFPSALEIESFYRGRIDMVKMKISPDSPVVNTALKDLPRKVSAKVLICILERGKEVVIPSGNTVLEAGDQISFIAKPAESLAFARECKLEKLPVNSVFMVGGGKIAYYVAELLETLKKKISMKVVEINPSTCNIIAERFPNVIVINADGSKKSTLIEEGVANTDFFLSLTGIDEENIILGLVVDELTDARLITKVNHMNPAEIPSGLSLGSIVCPNLIASNAIVRFARGLAGSHDFNIEALYKVAGGRVEAQEYEINSESVITGIPLKDLKTKSGVLVAAIIRDHQLIRPDGAAEMRVGDHVVIVTLADRKIRDLVDILE